MIQTSTNEKIFALLGKYQEIPKTVYLKVVDFAGNVLFDDSITVDLFKIDNFIKDLRKLSENYKIDIVIRYKKITGGDIIATFKHSL